MIFNIFSKRTNEVISNDPYEYSFIPEKLRMQVIYILRDANGRMTSWDIIRKVLLREYGKEKLISGFYGDAREECEEFIKKTSNINYFLDIVEVSFNFIDEELRAYQYNPNSGIVLGADDAINELNHRFKENNLGYEYCEGEIIRIDRKFTHEEIVKTSLNLLYEEDFKSANEEFMSAHKYYKEGCSKDNSNEDFKNAIINCNKAFESTMKIICEKKSELVTTYNNKHTANDLVNDLITANIIPSHLEHTFHGIKNILKGLRASLESGLPVIRNKVGHGKGTEKEWVAEEFVTYAINLTATNIVLLVNIYKNL